MHAPGSILEAGTLKQKKGCGHHAPGINTPTHTVETPASFEKALPAAILRGTREIVMSRSRHGAFSVAAILTAGFSAAGFRKF